MISTTHRTRIALLSCLSFTLIAATSLRAADRIQTGNWERSVTIKGHTSTLTRCVAKEEANAVNADTKSGRAYAEKEAKGTCTIQAYDVTGNTITTRMDCEGTLIEMTFTYHGDTYEGVSKSTLQGTQTTMAFKGRRLGPCQ